MCSAMYQVRNNTLKMLIGKIFLEFKNKIWKFSFRCAARAWSISNKITKLIGQHNHPPDEVEDFKPQLQDPFLGHEDSKTISGSGGEGIDDE